MVTDAPNRLTAWAISTPTAPPPSTSSRRGTSVSPVTSRSVQMPGSSRSPGTSGMKASAPVATTTCRAVYVVPSTTTAPGPASRPDPRMTSMPAPRAHATCPASS
jgi:hypothetical protein